MDQLIDSINSIKVTNLVAMFDVLVATAIVLVFYLMRSFIAKIIISVAYKIRGKEADVKKDAMFYPIKIFISLLGIYVAIRMFPINSQVRNYSDIAFEIIAILFASLFLCSLITPESIIFKTFLVNSKNKKINNFLCMIIKTVIWIVAFFFILYKQHINLSGLATGLGITSAIIALAAQDVVKNILAGMAILTDKPFEIGDWICVGDLEGTVVDITFRSTRIKTAGTTIVTIPNDKITSESVINASKMKQRRIDFMLGLSRTTTAEQIRKLSKRLKIVIENNPHVLPDSAQINLFNITDHSYEYKIYFNIDIISYVDYLKLKQEILCTIIEVIEKDHIDLAYPTQTLYLKNGEVQNEDFMPDDKGKDKKLSLKNALDNLGKLTGKNKEEN